jgi:hypothetical protein
LSVTLPTFHRMMGRMMGRLGWSRADSITFALRCQPVARIV